MIDNPRLRRAARAVVESWDNGDLDHNYDRIAVRFDELRDALDACVPANDPDAHSVGLDWCQLHDSRWDTSRKKCDKADGRRGTEPLFVRDTPPLRDS